MVQGDGRVVVAHGVKSSMRVGTGELSHTTGRPGLARRRLAVRGLILDFEDSPEHGGRQSSWEPCGFVDPRCSPRLVVS